MRAAGGVTLFFLLNVLVTFFCHVTAQDRVDESMRHLTPTPPAAENVDCHVSVRRVEQVAGRCITLGRNGLYACQAGVNLDPFSSECNTRGRRYRPRRRNTRRPRQ